jgi:hypothetical protein
MAHCAFAPQGLRQVVPLHGTILDPLRLVCRKQVRKQGFRKKRELGKEVRKMNYQKLILVGNVTRDAIKQTSKKGVAYTSFSVAVSIDKGRAVFFSVVAFSKLGETVAELIAKGREVLVEGRIEVGKTGRFGVVADKIILGKTADLFQETK